MVDTQLSPDLLREDPRLPKVPEPGAMVIFGASGDLTARKLIPALYELVARRRLPMEFAVVGVSRTEMSHEEFRARLRTTLDEQRPGGVSDEIWESFASGVFYLSGDTNKAETYRELKGFLKKLDTERGTRGNRAFYLAASPTLFPTIVERLGEARMNQGENGGWARVVLEKPFGRDLASAKALNRDIRRYFEESQIYRIDHYLGKETVQNIMALRFSNSIFEPVWSQHYVDHVQITVAEDIGVGTRAGFYEAAGALRDIVQNHLMQVLCLTAMEPPVAFDARSVREEKNVYPDSTTETFVALKLYIDNWRWAGVPFYVRTGKRLPKRVTEIAIQFKPTPHAPFAGAENLEPNVLVVRVQPDEGVSLKIGAKVPGSGFEIRSVNMDLLYGTAFLEEVPDAYQRLLLDLMLGDPTLFIRADETECAWDILEPVIRAWARKGEISFYPAGSWGPEEADELMVRDGRRWRRP